MAGGDDKTTEDRTSGPSEQTEPTKKVLLVEDNNVNLKVRSSRASLIATEFNFWHPIIADYRDLRQKCWSCLSVSHKWPPGAWEVQGWTILCCRNGYVSLNLSLHRHESLTNARHFNARHGRPHSYKGNAALRKDGWPTTYSHRYPDCCIICRHTTRGPSERSWQVLDEAHATQKVERFTFELATTIVPWNTKKFD